MISIEKEIAICTEILGKGKLILYPTDTIWGIGCDATNEMAVDKIFRLKKRDSHKTMIILVADEKDILNYSRCVNKKFFSEMDKFNGPTTVIYEEAVNLPSGVINDDGSIAIRVVKDYFCRTLIEQFQKPLVATSANISGETAPHSFSDISNEIKNGVDYIVQHRQLEHTILPPSAIIKLNRNGTVTKIRGPL